MSLISRMLSGLSEHEWEAAWKTTEPMYQALPEPGPFPLPTFAEWKRVVIMEGKNLQRIHYAVTGERWSLREAVQEVIQGIMMQLESPTAGGEEEKPGTIKPGTIVRNEAGEVGIISANGNFFRMLTSRQRKEYTRALASKTGVRIALCGVCGRQQSVLATPDRTAPDILRDLGWQQTEKRGKAVLSPTKEWRCPSCILPSAAGEEQKPD